LLPLITDRHINPLTLAGTIDEVTEHAPVPSKETKVGLREGFRIAGPARAVSPVRGPASESLRRTNPRERGEELPVYGDLAERRLCRGMILARSLRAESRVRRWIDRC
jgi:hypothetical protein